MATKAKVEIDEESIRRVNTALDGVPERTANKFKKKGLRKAAKIVMGEVKIVVPVGETKDLKKAVKTRAMKRSRTRIGMVVKIEKPYAANLEYGTKFIEARGFLAGAAERKRAEAIDVLVATLKELVQELNGKS